MKTWGYNVGRGIIQNGEIDMTIPEGGSNEAFEIMFFVKPGWMNTLN